MSVVHVKFRILESLIVRNVVGTNNLADEYSLGLLISMIGRSNLAASTSKRDDREEMKEHRAQQELFHINPQITLNETEIYATFSLSRRLR